MSKEKSLQEVRDQFAGFAFQMLVLKHPPKMLIGGYHTTHALLIARGAYSYADAMMEVRKGESK